MLYNFKTVADDQQWVIDTEALTWAKASSILAAPSVKAAEGGLARFEAVAQGNLAPFGNGVFRFVGMKEPQLAIIAIFWIPVTDPADGQPTMVYVAQANLDIKELKCQEIKRFKGECLPAAKPAPNPALKPVVQPPITQDERKAQAPADATLSAPLPDLSAADANALVDKVVEATEAAVPVVKTEAELTPAVTTEEPETR